MSRYSNTVIIKDTNTHKSYMQSTIYPKIKPTDDDLYIITTSADRLDLLANKYYGNTNMWWIIAVANNINDAEFFVEAGRQLRIPANVQRIMNDLRTINK